MAVQHSLCGTRSKPPKTGFLTTRQINVEQLSVTGKRMCTEYWLTFWVKPAQERKSVVRITDHPNMTQIVYCGRKATNQTNKHIEITLLFL